jgi:hypothetical protein
VRLDIERFLILWCTVMHNSITWPRHGCYQCRSCGRTYAVPWAEQESVSLRAPVLPIGAVFDEARTA